jgi:sec-independent protein translocase protein TatA
MDFLGIGPWELLLVLMVALIFLGPSKIVEFSRTLGKWVRAIKRAGSDFTASVAREVEKEENDPARPLPQPPSENHDIDGERRP